MPRGPATGPNFNLTVFGFTSSGDAVWLLGRTGLSVRARGSQKNGLKRKHVLF